MIPTNKQQMNTALGPTANAQNNDNGTFNDRHILPFAFIASKQNMRHKFDLMQQQS